MKVIYRPRTNLSGLKEDCIGIRRDDAQCSNRSTQEAVAGRAVVRCCTDPDCMEYVAELARALNNTLKMQVIWTVTRLLLVMGLGTGALFVGLDMASRSIGPGDKTALGWGLFIMLIGIAVMGGYVAFWPLTPRVRRRIP